MRMTYLERSVATAICFVFTLALYAQNESANSDEINFMQTTEEVSPFESPISAKLQDETRSKQTKLLSKLYDLRKSKSVQLTEIEKRKKQELSTSGEKNLALLEDLSAQVKKIESALKGIDRDIFEIKDFRAEKNLDKQMIKLLDKIQSEQFPQLEKENITPEEWNAQFDYIEKAEKADNNNKSDCSIVFNGIDPGTLQQKIQTSSEDFISYTHPKLERYYKEESFLTGNVSLIELGKNTYLALDIVIKSKDAIKNYGMIQVGSPLKVELIDGESVYLFAQANARGRLVPQTTSIAYQVLYLLEKTETKLLKKSEIDNVGIMWSSGYEKYDIYNIDVVKNQIDCLENFK